MLVLLGMEIMMLLKHAFRHHSQSAYANLASYLPVSATVMHCLSECFAMLPAGVKFAARHYVSDND